MKTILFAALAATSIDKALGTILGVSVISEGEAKGHELFIDSTTLGQVKTAAEQFADGLQVKIDHWSGFDGIVGVLKNFTVDGQQLRADLHLLQNHDARDRILEMAETMPSSFGLSIAFSGEHEEKEIDSEAGKIKARFARCVEIYSADLVDSPAANPTGLFSAADQTALVTALNEELTRLRSESVELAALRTEVVTLRSENQRITLEQTRLTGLYSALKSSLGLNAAAVVPPIASGASDQGTLVEQYEAMPPGTGRRAFFEKHKEALRAALSAPRN